MGKNEIVQCAIAKYKVAIQSCPGCECCIDVSVCISRPRYGRIKTQKLVDERFRCAEGEVFVFAVEDEGADDGVDDSGCGPCGYSSCWTDL